MKQGTLYIVATPIGNLEDMTFRAVRILKEVDLVAAEDTRHTRKLLTHFGISKPLTSYFDHNATFKGAGLIERLCTGASVALVTDAGTPCISDPGYQLVHDAIVAGISVIPIPGASAVVTALSASGLPSDTFAFIGFLPNRAAKRREKLAALVDAGRLLVFYEAPHRLAATIADMAEVLGERQAVVARELTKLHEEFIRGSLGELAAILSERTVRGESVILVAPGCTTEEESVDWEELLSKCLATGMSVKDAVKQVVGETGQKKGVVYQEAIRLVDTRQ